jgi:hypothetical protein
MTVQFESPNTALDTAIMARLKDAITAENGSKVPVFSDIPDGQVFPYIRIGDKAGNDSFRTKTNYGESIMYTINAFSQYKGMKEINSIDEQIKAAITSSYLNLSAFGFNHTVTNMATTNIFEDLAGGSDFGKTYHAAIRIEFKILKTEVTS